MNNTNTGGPAFPQYAWNEMAEKFIATEGMTLRDYLIMRRQAEGMRAMSKEEMARRQLEAADGARNAYPELTSWQLAQASQNFWRQEGPFEPHPIQPPPLTLWERFMRRIRA